MKRITKIIGTTSNEIIEKYQLYEYKNIKIVQSLDLYVHISKHVLEFTSIDSYNKTINNMVNQKFVMLERFKRSYILKNPYSMYEIKEQKLDILIDNLKNNMENIITKKTHLYENITSSYILTNPMILMDNKSNKLNNRKMPY